jgi:hypothetical protein
MSRAGRFAIAINSFAVGFNLVLLLSGAGWPELRGALTAANLIIVILMVAAPTSVLSDEN